MSFELIKNNILEDNKVDNNEREFLKDILSNGKLDKNGKHKLNNKVLIEYGTVTTKKLMQKSF